MLKQEHRILAFCLAKKLSNNELADIAGSSQTSTVTRNITFARGETDMEYDVNQD